MCATFWLWTRALRGADIEDGKAASQKTPTASFFSATFFGIVAGLAYVAMAVSFSPPFLFSPPSLHIRSGVVANCNQLTAGCAQKTRIVCVLYSINSVLNADMFAKKNLFIFGFVFWSKASWGGYIFVINMVAMHTAVSLKMQMVSVVKELFHSDELIFPHDVIACALEGALVPRKSATPLVSRIYCLLRCRDFRCSAGTSGRLDATPVNGAVDAISSVRIGATKRASESAWQRLNSSSVGWLRRCRRCNLALLWPLRGLLSTCGCTVWRARY